MISWRNHCLENVNLQGRRGKTPSFVPLDLDFTVNIYSKTILAMTVIQFGKIYYETLTPNVKSCYQILMSFGSKAGPFTTLP